MKKLIIILLFLSTSSFAAEPILYPIGCDKSLLKKCQGWMFSFPENEAVIPPPDRFVSKQDASTVEDAAKIADAWYEKFLAKVGRKQ